MSEFGSHLEERGGALLYPTEEIVIVKDGWAIITSALEHTYASHKTCPSERYKYGFSSYTHIKETECCGYCGGSVPEGIVALVKMMADSEDRET